MSAQTLIPIRQLMVQALCSPAISAAEDSYLDAAIDNYDAHGTSFTTKAKRIAKDVLTRECSVFAADPRLQGKAVAL